MSKGDYGNYPGRKMSNQVLGQGTYGVIICRDNEAIKQPVREANISGNAMTYTNLREFDIQFNLDHPNLLRPYRVEMDHNEIRGIYEVARNDGHSIFYSAEPLPHSMLRKMMYQLLLGLEHMHSHHIGHFDIKPSNILYFDRGDERLIVLADMGAALPLNHQESQNFQLITGGYRPPEMTKRDYRLLAAADIWSLGCCFYTMFTSKPLVGAASNDNRSLSPKVRSCLKKIDNRLESDLKLTTFEINSNRRYRQLLIDLLGRMLAPLDQRWSAAKLLRHRFFQSIEDPPSRVDDSTITPPPPPNGPIGRRRRPGTIEDRPVEDRARTPKASNCYNIHSDDYGDLTHHYRPNQSGYGENVIMVNFDHRVFRLVKQHLRALMLNGIDFAFFLIDLLRRCARSFPEEEAEVLLASAWHLSDEYFSGFTTIEEGKLVEPSERIIKRIISICGLKLHTPNIFGYIDQRGEIHSRRKWMTIANRYLAIDKGKYRLEQVYQRVID